MAKHALFDVRAAVAAGTISLGRKAAYDRMLGLADPDEGVFQTEEECRAFARDVLCALTPNDYGGWKAIPDNSNRPTHGTLEYYDEYGIELDPALLTKHGLVDESTWYVKLTYRASEGRRLFCMSLHRLEWPMNRPGGQLKPKW